jgi:hypothetical protein
MSKKSLTIQLWQEREDLRHELAAARWEMGCAANSLKHSLNPKERAQDFVRERPLAILAASVVAGAVAVKVLPGLLWRSKGNLLSRFMGELMKGAAGMALPLIAGKIAAIRNRRAPEPESIILNPSPLP